MKSIFNLLKKQIYGNFNTIKPIIGQPDYDMGYKFTPNVNKIWIKENKNRVKINNYEFMIMKLKIQIREL